MLHRFLLAALLGAALIPGARAADTATKPAVDDGIIRPTISETEQLKLEVQRLKNEIAALKKQISELQNPKSSPAPAPKDPPKDPAKAHAPEATQAAAAEGSPVIGMTETELDAMINKYKSAGAYKTLQSENAGGKILKCDSSLYTFTVLIEAGKIIRIYEVNKKKSAIFDPVN